MPLLAVTAVGADQPGIIARITRVLAEREGNLEDVSMTVLSGHFAIMLLVDATESAAPLEAELTRSVGDLGLVVTVREVGEGVVTDPPTHLLSVYGADRPGLVAGVSDVLAHRDVNVTDLTTRVIDGEEPVYAMLFEVTLPAAVVPERLADDVRRAVDGVDVTITALDAAVL